MEGRHEAVSEHAEAQAPTTPAPTYDRVAEVEALLAEDTTLLGRYWGYVQEGLTREEMGEQEAAATLGWTYNYAALADSLRTGRAPTSAGAARGVASRIRSWLRSKQLSPQLRADLEEQERAASSIAENPEQQAAEVETAIRATAEAEAAGRPGIYVYTLPHYIRHPFDPDTGKTLLKVGHSAVDAVYRANAQGRFTALPEDPILLRIYPVDASVQAERTFHNWLRDADHANGRGSRVGSEWFVTSTKFLDRVARSLDLEVIEVNPFDAGDL